MAQPWSFQQYVLAIRFTAVTSVSDASSVVKEHTAIIIMSSTAATSAVAIQVISVQNRESRRPVALSAS